MKKLLIFLSLLFAFVVVDAGVTSVWASSEKAEASGDHGKKADKEKEGEEEGGGHGEGKEDKNKKSKDILGGRFAGDPIYVRLPQLVMPVISNKGVQQIVVIQITVQVKDFDVGDVIHSNMPKVMDALMTALYGGLGHGTLRDGEMVSVLRVKTKATDALQKVLGVDNVQSVLIENMSQRML